MDKAEASGYKSEETTQHMTERFANIFRTIGECFRGDFRPEKLDAFELLIGTVLSQSTNSRNVMLAMANLAREFDISPAALSRADVKAIVRCIRPAGLHNMKGPRIKRIANEVQKKYRGDLRRILELPEYEARAKLMELPGVGMKTADILLAFVAKRDIMPVDTHIARVSKRLGLVSERAGYEEVKKGLEGVIPPERRRSAHLSIIEFGRRVCIARNPHCDRCLVARVCPSSAKFSRPKTTRPPASTRVG